MAMLADLIEFGQLSLTGLTMPVTIRPGVPLRHVELIALSRRNRPFRIEQNAEGELEVMPPLGFLDAHRETRVMCMLGNWAEQHGGLAFSSNVGVLMTDGSVRSPDTAWISQTRWDSLSKTEQEGFSPLCPDFLVEILSESDSRTTLEAKMEMWIANGAKLAWMIDPFAGDLTIYQPDETPRRLVRPDWVEAETVVPGFRLETRRLWTK